MGRTPCCDKNGLKKGPWTPEEDQKLIEYIRKNGYGNWRTLPKNAGLQRCGKSCRLRWTNYLRPDIKRGRFSIEEEETLIQLHSILGNKWSAIAARLPGRTDNEIKNYWNTHIRKKLLRMGIDPVTHSPRLDLLEISSLLSSSQMNLSRLLGVQHLVNPELLRLAATSLMSTQHSDQIRTNFHVQNVQENQLCSTNHLQNQESQNMVYQPNNQQVGPIVQYSDVEEQFSSHLSNLSFQHYQLNDQCQNNVFGDYVPQANSNYYRPSEQAALMDYPSSEISNFISNSNLSNQNFHLASVLLTPASPNPLNSKSTFVDSCTDHDEMENYCSNMLKITDFLDVNEYRI